MEENGRQIPVVSVSGGKDSTALYLWAMEKYEGNFKAVFADTGNENEITLGYVRDLPRIAGGPEITWVKADFTARIEKRKIFVAKNYPHERAKIALDALDALGAPFYQLCMLKGMFPCNTRRFCTSELKQIPINDDFMAQLLDSGNTVLSLQGIRADESPIRANALEYEQIDEGVTVHRPILKWSVSDVFDMHKRHGVHPNPLYSMGMSRVGCFPCIMSRKSEIAQISRRFPEHIAKIKTWESLVQRASRQGTTTFFSTTKLPGASTYFSPIDDVVSWATCTVPGQMKLPDIHNAPLSCHSLYGLCE